MTQCGSIDLALSQATKGEIDVCSKLRVNLNELRSGPHDETRKGLILRICEGVPPVADPNLQRQYSTSLWNGPCPPTAGLICEFV